MGYCDGRVVIVTGAGRGLGRAHALAFASQGAHVLVNDLGVARDGTAGARGEPEDAASAVVDEIVAAGGSALADRSDVADWDQSRSMVAAAIEEWGRLDTLVCNAGFLRDRMLVNMTETEWDSVVRVHLKGHFAPARHAVEHWRARAKSGDRAEARIVNTSSGAGLMGSIGQGNYAAAKAAIALLTVQQAAEWSRYGVRVNAVAPGLVFTPINEEGIQKKPEALERMMRRIPMGRHGTPEDIAGPVLFLVSDLAQYVTGVTLAADGGYLTI